MIENNHFEKPNLSYLLNLMDNNSEIVLEVLEMFKREVPKDMANLEQHLQNKDWEKLGTVAHKLKSSVGNLGLTQVRDWFLFLEQSGKSLTDLNKVPETVALTVKAIQQLYIDIDAEIVTLNANL